MSARKNQRGAALLIVLLLAATLAFIALATMELTTRAAARSLNVHARGEAIWGALGVETLSLAAVEEFAATNNGKMSLDDEWASQAIELPLDNGFARVMFADATTCFNVNSLGNADGDESGATSAAEFVRLAVHLGLGEYDAVALVESISDWVDQDNNRRGQGAEDEYYTTLASPYRTGNQPMASISEMRAVKGVSREIYATLKPYLCALADTAQTPINVNMLAERHAPVLAAALGEKATLQTARDIIAARRPGGYDAVTAFLAEPLVEALEPAETARFQVTSRYIQARAEIVYDSAVVEMTSDIVIEGERARLAGRRIGAEE